MRDGGWKSEAMVARYTEHLQVKQGASAILAAICHGGPIAMPDDAAYILANCPKCHGFYGASSMERLPTETALTAQTKAFTQIKPGSSGS
jgi:predicted TIM-barrel enzyme